MKASTAIFIAFLAFTILGCATSNNSKDEEVTYTLEDAAEDATIAADTVLFPVEIDDYDLDLDYPEAFAISAGARLLAKTTYYFWKKAQNKIANKTADDTNIETVNEEHEEFEDTEEYFVLFGENISKEKDDSCLEGLKINVFTKEGIVIGSARVRNGNDAGIYGKFYSDGSLNFVVSDETNILTECLGYISLQSGEGQCRTDPSCWGLWDLKRE